jgi:hypothetical protein
MTTADAADVLERCTDDATPVIETKPTAADEFGACVALADPVMTEITEPDALPTLGACVDAPDPLTAADPVAAAALGACALAALPPTLTPPMAFETPGACVAEPVPTAEAGRGSVVTVQGVAVFLRHSVPV